MVWSYKEQSPSQPYLQQPGSLRNSAPHSSRYHAAEEQDTSAERRRIAGLPTWAFWLVNAIIGLVIVGASVGGAVGRTVGSNNEDSSPAAMATVASYGTELHHDSIGQPTDHHRQIQTSSTPPPSSAASAGTSAPAAQYTADTAFSYGTSDCPGSNKQKYTPNGAGGGTGDYAFTKNCAMQLVTAGMDITEAFVPSFDLCIDMCFSWNYYEYASDDHPGAHKCVAAVFRPGGKPPGNCWIKNSSALANGMTTNGEQDTATLNDAQAGRKSRSEGVFGERMIEN